MTDAYLRGFAKTASDCGVDPAYLLKIAEMNKKAIDWNAAWDNAKFLGRLGMKAIRNPDKAMAKLRTLAENGQTLAGPEGTKLKQLLQNPTVKSIIGGASDAANWWSNLSPNAKRGIGGAALTGLGSLLFTDGNLFERLMKGISYGTLGGLGAYGLSRSGLYDKGRNYLTGLLGNGPVQQIPSSGTQAQQIAQQMAAAPEGTAAMSALDEREAFLRYMGKEQ